MPITFEIDYLRNLKENIKSCVYVVHGQEHLALHPFQLDNISNSIKELLNKNIAKYCNHLNGILLGYENVKTLSSDGLICGDSCFVHTDIEADFYVFKPEIDSTLEGVINKITKDHVACLVHKTFTISLPKPDDVVSWIGNKAQIGQEVQFTIVEAVFEGSLPYIKGSINSLDNIDDSGFSTNEEYQLETPKEKKAIRKRKLTESIDQIQHEEIVHTKHKKRKKEKIILPQANQEQTNQNEKRRKKIFEDDFLRVDFSIIQKDDVLENADVADNTIQENKSKKRKRSTSLKLDHSVVSGDITKEGKTKKRKRRSIDVQEVHNSEDVDSFSANKKNGISKRTGSRQHKKKAKSKEDESIKLNNDDASDDSNNTKKCAETYEDLQKQLSQDVGDTPLIGELNDLLSGKRSKLKQEKKLKKHRRDSKANESIELDLNNLFESSSSKFNDRQNPIKILSNIRISPNF